MRVKTVLQGFIKTGILIGGIAGAGYFGRKKLKEEKVLRERYASYYQLMSQWLVNKEEGKEIKSYFKEKACCKIAVYGMGTLGELFYNEVKGDAEIQIKYFIDKKAGELYFGLDDIPVIEPDKLSADAGEEVEMVIVTPIFDFEKISNELSEAGCRAEIVSLEEIVHC